MPSSSAVKAEQSASPSRSTSRKKSSGGGRSGSSSGSGGSSQLTALEKRIWQAAIAEPGHVSP
jgi:hypothetical protein